MEKIFIEGIFSKYDSLKVPFFQRSYVWEEDNWERFLEDMESTCKSNKPYCMGTIIYKVPDKIPEGLRSQKLIIDGQQRFTTISLFFLVLSIKQHNNYDESFLIRNPRQPCLYHNKNDKEIYDLLFKKQSLDEKIVEKYKNNNVYKAYNYFMDKIQENDSRFDVDCLMQNIYFFPISLLDGDDEQQIFDTINSLGTRLSAAELLKNTLYKDNDEALFNKTWELYFEKENKEFWDYRVGSRDDISNLDLFLYSYLIIKTVEAEENVAQIRYKDLFKSYKKYLDEKVKDKEAFIDDLIDYAKIYNQYVDPNILNETLEDYNDYKKRFNIIIFGLDTATILPFYLYLLKNGELHEINKILKYLETYIIRRMLCQRWTKNYNKFFRSFIKQNNLIYKNLEKFILERRNTEDSLPEDIELKEQSNGNHNSKAVKGILYLLELSLRDSNKSTTSLKSLSKYDLEHILPMDDSKWPLPDSSIETMESRSIHKGSLGNKTLLSQSLNKAIKNEVYEKKLNGFNGKQGYKEYAQGLKTFDFIKYKEWNESTIDERKDELISKIIKVWPYKEI